MNNIFFIYLSTIVFIFSSCKNKTTDNNTTNNSITKTSNCKKLIAKEIYTEEIFDVIDISICNQDLIISGFKSKNLIHVYHLPDFKLKNKFGEKGESPLDLNVCFLSKSSSNKVFIGGFNGGKTFYKYNELNGYIDIEKPINILNVGEPMNDIFSTEEKFIYNSIFDLKINEYNFHDKEVKTIYELDKDDHKESFFYSNKGKMASNDSVMVYTYFYKDQIDFIDSNGKIKKSIIGKIRNPVITMGDFEANTVTYINAYATKNNFYILYRGKTHKEFIKAPYEDVLIVFNNKGDVINKYSFDIPPIIFAVDEENNTLYGYNGMYKDVILKYSLDNK